ncbi:DUF86 domain-containing protein [bacterium]|nr:DUF86 domain-containing protein [bacterium]
MISLLEDDFIRSHPEIPWRQIKGARNIYVHGYGELDLDEVWNTLTESVPLLKNQISELLVNFEKNKVQYRSTVVKPHSSAHFNSKL